MVNKNENFNFITNKIIKIKLLDEIEHLVQSLIYYDFSELATELYEETKSFLLETNVKLKTLAQQVFEKENPHITELYPNDEEFKENIKSNNEIAAYFAKLDFILKK